jgi:hypothetical protein
MSNGGGGGVKEKQINYCLWNNRKKKCTDTPACTVSPSLLEYITVLFMGQKHGIYF